MNNWKLFLSCSAFWGSLGNTEEGLGIPKRCSEARGALGMLAQSLPCRSRRTGQAGGTLAPVPLGIPGTGFSLCIPSQNPPNTWRHTTSGTTWHWWSPGESVISTNPREAQGPVFRGVWSYSRPQPYPGPSSLLSVGGAWELSLSRAAGPEDPAGAQAQAPP